MKVNTSLKYELEKAKGYLEDGRVNTAYTIIKYLLTVTKADSQGMAQWEVHNADQPKP